MNRFNDTEKKKFSHTFEDILVPHSCSFNTNPCVAEDFVWYFDPWFGNCWIYNSEYNRTGPRVPLRVSAFPDESYGL